MTTAVRARPLQVGPITVDPPVVLAPMAGVTDAPFRRLVRSFGPALTISEMITTRALVERNAKTIAMATFAPDEPVRSVQLYGVDPAVTAEAVRIVVGEIGADHVDLNFGCPAAKVTKRGGGAALPHHHRLFGAIVEAAVSAAAPVPVTVKLRMGISDDHLTFTRSGRIAADAGSAYVALHARTAEQLYSGGARWDAIGELKAAVDSVPVLGNGDIWEPADAVAMMEETGCDGVVVGRGCLGRPWLFAGLAAAMRGEPVPDFPAFGEVADVMRRHAGLLRDGFGERLGMLRFRKHAAWYVTGFPVGSAVRQSLPLVSSIEEMETILAPIPPGLELAANARRTPRGHTGGPRPVQLPPDWLASPDDPTPPVGAEALVSGG